MQIRLTNRMLKADSKKMRIRDLKKQISDLSVYAGKIACELDKLQSKLLFEEWGLNSRELSVNLSDPNFKNIN
jgi:hypothetical protein